MKMCLKYTFLDQKPVHLSLKVGTNSKTSSFIGQAFVTQNGFCIGCLSIYNIVRHLYVCLRLSNALKQQNINKVTLYCVKETKQAKQVCTIG